MLAACCDPVVTMVAVVAADAGVVTMRGCLGEAAPIPPQTTHMTMGITMKSTISPTVTPTIMPKILTTPR